MYGQRDTARLLVEKGADIDTRCNNVKTPLLWAVEKGHEATADLLLAKGASVQIHRFMVGLHYFGPSSLVKLRHCNHYSTGISTSMSEMLSDRLRLPGQLNKAETL